MHSLLKTSKSLTRVNRRQPLSVVNANSGGDDTPPLVETYDSYTQVGEKTRLDDN